MREKNYTFFSGSTLSYCGSRQYRMKIISKGLSESSKVNSSIFIRNIQIVDQDLFKDHFCFNSVDKYHHHHHHHLVKIQGEVIRKPEW